MSINKFFFGKGTIKTSGITTTKPQDDKKKAVDTVMHDSGNVSSPPRPAAAPPPPPSRPPPPPATVDAAPAPAVSRKREIIIDDDDDHTDVFDDSPKKPIKKSEPAPKLAPKAEQKLAPKSPPKFTAAAAKPHSPPKKHEAPKPGKVIDDDDDDDAKSPKKKQARKVTKKAQQFDDIAIGTGAERDAVLADAANTALSIDVAKQMAMGGGGHGAPPNKGVKQLPPLPSPNGCLNDLGFIVTGVLDSLEREEAQDMIRRYGGTIKSGVTKKVDYAVVGAEAGPAKISKIKELDIKAINEDGLIDLICKRSVKLYGTGAVSSPPPPVIPEQHPVNHVVEPVKQVIVEQPIKKAEQPKPIKLVVEQPKPIASKPTETASKPVDQHPVVKSMPKGDIDKLWTVNPSNVKLNSLRQQAEILRAKSQQESELQSAHVSTSDGVLWVDKYAPSSSNDLVGNGAKIKELKDWLSSWTQSSTKKAALISGPPGIGKTTSARIACKECGYEAIEMNASDTRNKASLEETVYNLVETKSITQFFIKNATPNTKQKSKCLIFDEVDGMAGNEDRGGLRVLLDIIKKSRIPIINICNERSQKMTTLANHCLDLKFTRPPHNAIAYRLKLIAQKEGFDPKTLNSQALEKIAESVSGDLRQALHALQSIRTSTSTLLYDDVKKRMESTKKDESITTFPAAEKLLRAEGCFDFEEKSDLYFVDFGIMPLFVQENYLTPLPLMAMERGALNEMRHLELCSMAADSICGGDLIDAVIRSSQAFELLPTHAALSAVIPSWYVRGRLSGFPSVKFPTWLARNSTGRKQKRLASEVHIHLRLTTTASIGTDYSLTFARRIISPLTTRLKDGIDDVITMMDKYYLTKEYADFLIEISTFKEKSDYSAIPTDVKTAFTRKLNATARPTPFSESAIKAVKTAVEETVAPVDESGTAVAVEDKEEAGGDDDKADDAEVAKLRTKKGKAKATGGAKPKATKAKAASAPKKSKKKSKDDDDE